MTQTLLSSTKVVRESLRVLHQKLNFIGSVSTEYDDQYAKSGAKIGSTLKIREPNAYVVRSGKTLTTQETVESSIDLTVSTQKGVDLSFSSEELTMSLDDFSTRIIKPAMSVLAASMEADALSMFKQVPGSIWNGTAAATYNKYIDARTILQNNLTPAGDRTALLDSLSMGDLVKDTKTLFHDDKSLSKQYKEGYMGRAAGFDFEESTIIPSFTRGAGNTAYVTNGATLTGASTLVIDTGAGAIAEGDVFTVAGVYAVHPETKVSTGVLKKFVAGADATTTSLPFTPAMVSATGKQNVSALPADGAAIVFFGTASTAVGTSLAYHKEAFAFATADLVMPKGVDFASRQVLDGISMRIVRAYDINGDLFPCRLDVLYGYKTLRADLACRVHNN